MQQLKKHNKKQKHTQNKPETIQFQTVHSDTSVGQRTKCAEPHFCGKLGGQSSSCSDWGKEWKGGYCISIYVALKGQSSKMKDHSSSEVTKWDAV